MKPRPSHEKRRKEQLRKTRQQDKAERRAAKKLTRGEGDNVDQAPVIGAVGLASNARNDNSDLVSGPSLSNDQTETT